MEEKCSGGRTHEPSLRELCADLDGFKRLMDERDKRYEQSFTQSKESVASALAAAKEQTSASFNASEKAIAKAESSQLQYNATHNDLTRKMDAQYKEMLPRLESEGKFNAIAEKIEDVKRELNALRDFRSETVGQRVQQTSDKGQSNWVIGIAIGLILAVVEVILKLVKA